jgi:trans-aconitate 2-methyltransferase
MWNAEQYERFKAERSLPFFDLLGLVRRGQPIKRVVDLGCGTGQLTATLHETLGAGETLGIDSSAEMLAKAPKVTGLTFQRDDIESFQPGETFDVVFSNAALQWVPDHRALFARLAGWLGPGGQLAVQMPANFDHPSHVVAEDVALEAPFAEALGGWRRGERLLPVEDYARLLSSLGFVEQRVRLEVYAHRLPSRADVVEWVKGTLLTDYKKRLSAELYERFLERYRQVLLPQLEDTAPYLYPFKRVLLWAARA